MRAAALLALALALASCGWNPTEGDFGPVEVVPERDVCWVTVRERDSAGVQVRVYTEPRPCEGKDHDVKFLGRRW
jgi:hypothetical protein